MRRSWGRIGLAWWRLSTTASAVSTECVSQLQPFLPRVRSPCQKSLGRPGSETVHTAWVSPAFLTQEREKCPFLEQRFGSKPQQQHDPSSGLCHLCKWQRNTQNSSFSIIKPLLHTCEMFSSAASPPLNLPNLMGQVLGLMPLSGSVPGRTKAGKASGYGRENENEW